MQIKRYVEVETPTPEGTGKFGRLRTLESKAIDDFIHSNAKVLIFTYDTIEECMQRHLSVYKIVAQSKDFSELHISRNKKQMYLIKD